MSEMGSGFLFLPILLASFSVSLQADMVLVLSNTGHGSTFGAINNLNALGHTVTTSSTALTDYSGFDQVWDLRFTTVLSQPEQQAFANFLGNGGNMYLSGKNATFDSRNNGINSFLSFIGAGTVGLVGNTSGGLTEVVTADGQVVMDPNPFTTLNSFFARSVSAPGSGFLVTETAPGSGLGSLVGWDFGDLAGQPDSRLMVGFDIELFNNGVDWTDNVVTYLGGSNAVPEPGSALLIPGLASMACLRRRRS